jgi:hypothetical protein
MQLPAPIRTYFTARAPLDGDVLAKAFAARAMVHDEGRSHHGPQAIRDWWLAVKARYHHHAEPMDIAEAGGKTRVTAKVTGDFPGSPAVLTFVFGLDGDLITNLEIG